MDQFKFSLGPYELFSAIISGIPLLLALYLGFRGDMQIENDPLGWIDAVSFTTVSVVALLSYFTGTVMSGFSFTYFKFLCRLMKVDYRQTEIKLLRNLASIDLSKPVSERFEDRLAYLVKKHLGDTSDRWACTRLMPYLRRHVPHLSAQADQFMAQKIMLRNISFGFFVLSVTLLIKTLVFDAGHAALYIASLICFYVAYFSFRRALIFRGWWAREILLGFYHTAGTEGVRGAGEFAHSPG